MLSWPGSCRRAGGGDWQSFLGLTSSAFIRLPIWSPLLSCRRAPATTLLASAGCSISSSASRLRRRLCHGHRARHRCGRNPLQLCRQGGCGSAGLAGQGALPASAGRRDERMGVASGLRPQRDEGSHAGRASRPAGQTPGGVVGAASVRLPARPLGVAHCDRHAAPVCRAHRVVYAMARSSAAQCRGHRQPRPERTLCTRFIPPEVPEQMTGAWQDYYRHWRAMTRDTLDPAPARAGRAARPPLSACPHPRQGGLLGLCRSAPCAGLAPQGNWHS